MSRWSLNPIFDSYALVGLMIGGLLLLVWVGPRYRRLADGRRRVLASLRIGLTLLLALALLRPALTRVRATPQTSLLVLMLDESRSMQLPHSSGSHSRWDAQRAALEAAQGELKRVAQEMDLRLYTYAAALQPRQATDGQLTLPDTPAGEQTDIGTSLQEALQRDAGRRIAAVLLLGDGAQNAFAPRVDPQQAARELARLDCPLYTITFGPPGTASQARDVAVENMPERYTAFAGNQLEVQGAIRLRGFVNRPVPVELLVEAPDGASSVAGEIEVSVAEDDQVATASLTLTPQQAGEYKLTLRAAELPGELSTQNNQLSAFLTVREGGLRVLYVYGNLTGEQRLLRRSLDASPDIQLDALYVDRRNREQWPLPLAQQLEREKYDVVLLEDVDATALGETGIQDLVQRVGDGLGVMMIGGFNSFGPGGYYGTALADALPIRMGRFERQSLDPQAPISEDLHWWDELAMRPSRPHPVTTLAEGSENVRLWQSLPPLQGGNRLLLKPASQVLLESPDAKPLLVAGTFGRARVLAFAGNTTHRWWQHGRQLEHRRFWRQVVLWLARREDLARQDVWIKLPQRRMPRGVAVDFTAGVTDATGVPLTDVDLVAELQHAGRTSAVNVSSTDEHWHGTLPPLQQAGDYVLQVSASRQGQPLGSTRASFQVLARDLELDNPAADFERMAQLADLTSSAGGRAVAPEELPDLLAQLRRDSAALRTDVLHRWQFGDTALDAWLFFLVTTCLIASEWVLRRRWGLV